MGCRRRTAGQTWSAALCLVHGVVAQRLQQSLGRHVHSDLGPMRLWITSESGAASRALVERDSEVLTGIDVDDDGASCDAAPARVLHAESLSGSRICTRRCSASNQQSRGSSSSERYSESHRCKGLGRPK